MASLNLSSKTSFHFNKYTPLIKVGCATTMLSPWNAKINPKLQKNRRKTRPNSNWKEKKKFVRFFFSFNFHRISHWTTAYVKEFFERTYTRNINLPIIIILFIKNFFKESTSILLFGASAFCYKLFAMETWIESNILKLKLYRFP